ncbi:hypothetical protein WICPIJ_007025 [Wickerhamomyces pijperi]|uniref:Uncharacterized protein n=1 Tax=Wickerhamomyces pijperi TaxID=599730 RepID=A0A9P8TKU8_WICPI|nr:hypothetical protein WICPIJ_007025 [Wickerhamomyces pijperi]
MLCCDGLLEDCNDEAEEEEDNLAGELKGSKSNPLLSRALRTATGVEVLLLEEASSLSSRLGVEAVETLLLCSVGCDNWLDEGEAVVLRRLFSVEILLELLDFLGVELIFIRVGGWLSVKGIRIRFSGFCKDWLLY